jgi:chromosome segregation ATPase
MRGDYQKELAKTKVIELLESVKEGESVANILSDTTKQREDVEKKLKEDIGEYFQNYRLCETMMDRCDTNIKTIQTNFKDLDKSLSSFAWARNSSIEKLVTLRKNLNQVVDTLHDFLNVSSQMKDLRKQLTDYRMYENVHRKLLTICSLRDSMMTRSSSNKRLEQTFKNFSERFKEIKTLEEEFYNTIFDNLANAIDLAKTDPRKLTKTLKVIEIADLTSKQPNAYFEKSLVSLRRMVKQRFEGRIGDENSTDIGSKLEAAKYSVDDLMDVHQHLVPLFPQKYNIFDFMRAEYKKLIESLVMPYLNNLESLKEDPGVILYFIGWLENYEVLLKRVGIEGSEEYSDLRNVTYNHSETEGIHASILPTY